jgi:bifunctional UDP-N-acetylglucosamine pyrophosphorylase/glucosamine-1-phosphate N-acetyltransferase
MLTANVYMVRKRTGQLTQHVFEEGSVVSDKACIKGYIHLGRNSYIGDNVLIKGSVIAGDNTIIDNGAIINGDAIIGDNTVIRNYCQVYDGVSIGDNCILDHGAEFIGGMIMDKVYLYHYCEMFGAIGSYTDIGAATVCGILRFDDGETQQLVKGRRETPAAFGNAVYLGDYCRTGVNAILMPGCKVGSYSVVGPGVILNRDLEENSFIEIKQELTVKTWNTDKYGW